MHAIVKYLRSGKGSSEKRVGKVVSEVLENPKLFEILFDDVLHPNPAIRQHTADAVDRVSLECPELLQPHKNTLIYKLSKVEQKEIRCHVSRMLPRLKISSREHSSVVSVLVSYLEDKSQEVRHEAMLSLEKIINSESFASNDDFQKDVKALLERATKSASIESARTNSKNLLEQASNVA